jgi:tetratricopeptide (TPR) repeat protein
MDESVKKNDPRVPEAIKQALQLHSNGQTELAVEQLAALLAEFPAVGSLHGYIALFLYFSGQLDKAIEHAVQAVVLSPRSELASFIYFRVLWKAGRHVEALDEMKRFLTIKPSRIYSDMIKEWDLSEDEQSLPTSHANEVRERLSRRGIEESDVTDTVDWAGKVE